MLPLAGRRLQGNSEIMFATVFLVALVVCGSVRTTKPDRTVSLSLLSHVEPGTVKLHESAILDLQEWLLRNEVPLSLFQLLEAPTVLAGLLVGYGQHLYRTRKPRYWYVMAITALQRHAPSLKAYFGQVWQLNSNWKQVEPTNHRKPIPCMLVKALCMLGLATGQTRFSGIIILSFWGLARVGEVIRNFRRNLLLPADTLYSNADRTFLHYDAPKSRNRGGAAQQHSLVRGLGLSNLLAHIFSHLKGSEPLYPFSVSTFRNRWDRFFVMLGIGKDAGFLPGGMRGGGAVHQYMNDCPVHDIMWRMRIRQTSTLEHYLQEVAAIVSLRGLPEATLKKIEMLGNMFDHILESMSMSTTQRS